MKINLKLINGEIDIRMIFYKKLKKKLYVGFVC